MRTFRQLSSFPNLVLTWRSARPQARASGCPPGGFDDRRRGLQAAGAAGGGRLRPGCADSAGEAAGSARPLLLSGGQIVTVDQLAELLWSTSPPPSATITIQNYVRRLRLALGAAGRDRIVTQPGGYVIRLEPGELDVITMEQELAAARRSARDSAWPLAAGHAAAALALWRGEPLSGVDVPLLALQEIPRLAELRLQAQELRIEADLRMGRDAELLTELRQLTRTAPLREHLHALSHPDAVLVRAAGRSPGGIPGRPRRPHRGRQCSPEGRAVSPSATASDPPQRPWEPGTSCATA
jgi:hypothetical protein